LKKPNVAAIRAATPLTALPTRGDDPISCCNVCGQAADPVLLQVWREHDEHDRPIGGDDALVFLMGGREHDRCRKILDEHPRLYAEEGGRPGSFPAICGACPFRSGTACTHPKLKTNGGPGLLVTLDRGAFANAIICMGGGRRYRPIHRAIKCEGREEETTSEGTSVKYIGKRDDEGGCMVFHEDEHGVSVLRPRFDLRRHSPDGFNWGYEGSGPAQLALALLADYLGRPETAKARAFAQSALRDAALAAGSVRLEEPIGDTLALALYQRFKRAVVAHLGDGWTLTGAQIDEALFSLADARQASTP